MRILFLFLRHSEDTKSSTLTKDLSDKFHKNGAEVTVVTLLEKKYKRETQLKKENGYDVLRVKSGNYFDSPGKIEKGITALTMPYSLKKGIKENLGERNFDLIFTHTPFISNPKLLKWLKKYYNCPIMINLWDIFPQNAVDLKMLNNSFLIKFFKKTEEEMYEVADYIGCMSEGNLNYMKTHDKKFKENKYFVLKNWAQIKPKLDIDKLEIRTKYGYTKDDLVCIFGGNMGKPQKLENILNLAKEVLYEESIKFLFVGKGTETERLKRMVSEEKIENVKFIEQIPREDYEVLTGACDVGIVSLDERFTVPNFPSKTTDYFKLGLPILASLDSCSAEDYGKFLQEDVQGGVFAPAGDIDKLKAKLLQLYSNVELRESLGKNGREYYEKELGVNKAYRTIMEELKNV